MGKKKKGEPGAGPAQAPAAAPAEPATRLQQPPQSSHEQDAPCPAPQLLPNNSATPPNKQDSANPQMQLIPSTGNLKQVTQPALSTTPAIQMPTNQATQPPQAVEKSAAQPSPPPTQKPAAQTSPPPAQKPAAQPSPPPVQKPAAQPTPPPAQKPAAQPSPPPAQKPAAQPSPPPAQKPAAQPSPPPVQKPAAQPTPTPVQKPAAQPTPPPAQKPAAQPTPPPAQKPAAQPSPPPAQKPAAQPSPPLVQKPAAQPSPPPAQKPAAQPSPPPAQKPAAQPSPPPVQKPAAQPSPPPAQKPAAQPSPPPAQKPAAQPSPPLVQKPAAQPSPPPAQKPAAQPSPPPAQKPAAQPSPPPVQKPAAQPSPPPAQKPAAQPSPPPAQKPAAQPTPPPAQKPVAQPTPPPAQKPAAQPSPPPAQKPAALKPTARPTPPSSQKPATQSAPSQAQKPAKQVAASESQKPSDEKTSSPQVTPKLPILVSQNENTQPASSGVEEGEVHAKVLNQPISVVQDNFLALVDKCEKTENVPVHKENNDGNLVINDALKKDQKCLGKTDVPETNKQGSNKSGQTEQKQEVKTDVKRNDKQGKGEKIEQKPQSNKADIKGGKQQGLSLTSAAEKTGNKNVPENSSNKSGGKEQKIDQTNKQEKMEKTAEKQEKMEKGSKSQEKAKENKPETVELATEDIVAMKDAEKATPKSAKGNKPPSKSNKSAENTEKPEKAGKQDKGSSKQDNKAAAKMEQGKGVLKKSNDNKIDNSAQKANIIPEKKAEKKPESKAEQNDILQLIEAPVTAQEDEESRKEPESGQGEGGIRKKRRRGKRGKGKKSEGGVALNSGGTATASNKASETVGVPVPAVARSTPATGLSDLVADGGLSAGKKGKRKKKNKAGTSEGETEAANENDPSHPQEKKKLQSQPMSKSVSHSSSHSSEKRAHHMQSKGLAHTENKPLCYQFPFPEIPVPKPSDVYVDQLTKCLQLLAKAKESPRPDTDPTHMTDSDDELEYNIMQRVVFLPHMCHVCKMPTSSKNEPLRECSECKLILYCSEEHRLEHLPVHRDLCRVVSNICKNEGMNNFFERARGLPPEAFRHLRVQSIIRVASELGRDMELWEKEMFYFNAVCHTCYESNRWKLNACDKCSFVHFCQPSHLRDDHNKWCKDFKLYTDLVRYQSQNGMIQPGLPSHISKDCKILPNSIHEHIASLQGSSILSKPLSLAVLTDIATCPLSVLLGLQTVRADWASAPTLTVHLVGAEAHFELDTMHKWEAFLLHALPSLRRLHLVFVGPELRPELLPARLLRAAHCCAACTSAGRQLLFDFQPDQLYHEYRAGNPVAPAPDLVCAFNAGLYRSTGFAGCDSWPTSIAAMLAAPCPPVLVTAYTAEELPLDLTRMQQCGQLRLLMAPVRNPFASCKPSLNFVSEENVPLIFKNFYISIVQGVNTS